MTGALYRALRIAIQRTDRAIERRRGIGREPRRVELEVDVRQLDLFLDLAAAEVDTHAVRRARALVLVVGDAVAIAVRGRRWRRRRRLGWRCRLLDRRRFAFTDRNDETDAEERIHQVVRLGELV